MAEYSTFRRTTWDPVLILSQIATVQCFGYSSFGFAMVVLSVVSNVSLSPRLLFDAQLVRSDSVEGWCVALALVAMGLANIVPLVYMVERSRLCVDFSVTFTAVHVILVAWHMHALPSSLLWWLCLAAAAALMALGGRAACLRREMLPIAIRSFMPNHPAERQTLSGGAAEEHELESVRTHRDTPDAAAPAEVIFDSAPSNNNNGDDGDEWGMDSWDGDASPDTSTPLPDASSAPSSHAGTPLTPRFKGAKGD
ncbi:hypothetical protein EV175_007069 [Coemansia sp. RSA 1933]|nr:hypothetical protein EV175_007069 [Coemansia sp. RSA 1933]